MAFLAPAVVVNNAPPALAVTLTGDSNYQQLKNSLGLDIYHVKRIYLITDNNEQIRGGFTYSRYDSTGKQVLETVTTTLDPFQAQPSLYVDVSDKGVILDGRNYIRFPLLANTNVSVKLLAEKISSQEALNRINPNNFQKLEQVSSRMSFLKDYKDYV